MLPARDSIGSALDRELMFLAVVGLWVGSVVGAMAQIVPYSMVLLLGMGMALLAWRQEGSADSLMVMVGLLIGSLFGNMGSIMPYGVTIFLAVVTAAMVWRSQGGSLSSSPTTTVALILFLIVAVGFLWSGTYLDFCNPQLVLAYNACLNPGASGYITAWAGCVNDCAITPFTFLGTSPLAFLASGNLIGFIQSFFQIGSQSPVSFVAGFITIAAALVFLLLGTGLGINLQVLIGTGGGVQPNMQGTRLFQALGTGLLIWSAVTTFIFGFGAIFSYIGFGLGGGVGGGAIYIMFVTLYTYELYEQGRVWV